MINPVQVSVGFFRNIMIFCNLSSLQLWNTFSAPHSAKVCKATKKHDSVAQMYLLLWAWGAFIYMFLCKIRTLRKVNN